MQQISPRNLRCIGGWTFNDPPTQNIFSNMVASTANTNAFIKSILSVMETYAFDGIDVDWEVCLDFGLIRRG